MAATPSRAEQALRSVSWAELSAAQQLQNGRLLPDGSLEVSAVESGAAVTIFEISDPGISAPAYAITGEVRCDEVHEPGYLEMWSHFADDSAYFSRTLGTGPLAPLKGTSAWRTFTLPFFNKPGAPSPTRLSVGIHLPNGRVQLRSVRLVQYAPGEDPMRANGAWWSDRQSDLAGGIVGSLVGLLGALIGLLAGSGRARGVVLGTLRAMQVIGILALALGGIALAKAQPYSVYYPPLLLGVLAFALPMALIPAMRRRYQDLELRRITALDASS